MQARRTNMRGRSRARGRTWAWRSAFGQGGAGDRGFAFSERPVLGSLAQRNRRIDRSGIARQAKTDRPDQAQ
jgi:hypothetical protein